MKWVLYVMLFSTSAANISGDDKKCLANQDIKNIRQILLCRPNYEAKRLWSLQSTSQTDFSLFESCVKMQDKLIVSSNVASTMALRSWCICESEGANKCPTDLESYRKAQVIRDCEISGKTDCVQDEKVAKGFESEGHNSSTVQLYPLSKQERQLIFEAQPRLRQEFDK